MGARLRPGTERVRYEKTLTHRAGALEPAPLVDLHLSRSSVFFTCCSTLAVLSS